MILAVVGMAFLMPSLFAGDSDPPEAPIKLAAVEVESETGLTTSQKLAREIRAHFENKQIEESVAVTGSLNCEAQLYSDGSLRMFSERRARDAL